MNRIYKDYLSSNKYLRNFFVWLPEESLQNKLNELIQQFYKNETSTKSNTISTTLSVISGQQPGIFAGPLYTLYKILTLLELTKKLNLSTHGHFQPIFWIHSWDHDWEEVCQAHFLTHDYQIFSYTYQPNEDDKGKSIFAIRLNKSKLAEIINTIKNVVRSSDLTPTVVKMLYETLDNSDNVSDWAVNILKRVIPDSNLSWFEPHKITPSKPFLDLIQIAIENHEELFKQFQKTSTELLQLGYKLQVHKSPHDAFFFLEENGVRSKIIKEKEQFYSLHTNTYRSIQEMKEILKYQPERFTPNLILRCAYQQMIFPCIMYIAGPAEIAYWAQLRDLFYYLNIPLPIIFPRKRITIIPTKIKKWLDLYNLKVDEVQHEKTVPTNTSSPTEKEILDKKEKLLLSIESFFNEVIEQENLMSDQSIKSICKKQIEKISSEIEKTIAQIKKAHWEKDRIYVQRLNAIQNTIFPLGKEQERVLSPFSFLFEYDTLFIHRLHTQINWENFEQQVMEL